jgi:hypothetical protein
MTFWGLLPVGHSQHFREQPSTRNLLRPSGGTESQAASPGPVRGIVAVDLK